MLARQSKRLAVAIALSFVLIVSVAAEPGAHWQSAAPASGGWIGAVASEVEAYGAARRPTAVMAVHGDQVIATFGDTAHRVNVRSVRKSFLSALYGILIAEGRINPASTLTELGVDDQPSLTEGEKRATVRDLLMARSGIYHPAAYETPDMRKKRPARGSHAAGEFWYYNNWDFNALGTIFRGKGGEDIFESFERHIARPIDMEDFAAKDCRYHREPSSIHEAYLFEISARDLARFGLLFANDGRWNGKQIVAEAWVRESTTSYSQTDRPGRGYGYLWWTVSPEQAGASTVMASGFGGQLVAVIPSKKLVVVQTVDLAQNAKPLRTTVFLDLLRKIVALTPGN